MSKRHVANALHIAKSMGRKGYATEGSVTDNDVVYDPMGNVAVPPQSPDGAEPTIYDRAIESFRQPENSRVWESIKQGFGEQPFGGPNFERDRANYPVLGDIYKSIMFPAEAAMRIPGALIGGASGLGASAYEASGASPSDVGKLQRDLNVLGNVGMIESGFVRPRAPTHTDAIPRGGDVFRPEPLARKPDVRSEGPIIEGNQRATEAPRQALPEPMRQLELARPEPEAAPVAEPARAGEPLGADPNWAENYNWENPPDPYLQPKDSRSRFKDRGGNWLDDIMSPANSLSSNIHRLKELSGVVDDPFFASNLPEGEAHQQVSKWLDTKLSKYVKTEMGTADDPLLALAEQGISHTHPQQLGGIYRENQNLVSQSPLARAWENASTSHIDRPNAEYFQDPMVFNPQAGKPFIETHPWLSKLSADTPLYAFEFSDSLSELGFSHLTDELLNATRPDSNLPANLRLDPKKLDRVSVPQAVQLVDKINKWRAENMQAAELARSQNPAVHPIKEYPEGYKWVEIKNPEYDPSKLTEADLPEDYVVNSIKYPDETYGFTVGDASSGREVTKAFDTPQEALQNYFEQHGHPALQDALSYEGDVMGHCVGSYCKKVNAGSTQIYSLRDARGEPHATIEARTAPYDYWMSTLTRQANDVYKPEQVQQEAVQRMNLLRQRFDSFLQQGYSEDIAKRKAADFEPKDIYQIKGKQNLAPNNKYIPFVQDFVRSGNWRNIEELFNAKMYDHDEIARTQPDTFRAHGTVKADAIRKAKAAGELPRFTTKPEWEEILKRHMREGIDWEPRASGGRTDHSCHCEGDRVERGGFWHGGAVEKQNRAISTKTALLPLPKKAGDSTIVNKALMLVSSKAKRQRGRP
jgi:hypothetical protein